MLDGRNICKKKLIEYLKNKRIHNNIEWYKHFPKEKVDNVLGITKHNENSNENRKEISCSNKNVYYQRS